MTEDQWIEIAATIDAAWPRAELPESTVKVWYRLLRDLDAEDVRAAVARLAATETFPPSAAALREAATPGRDYEDALGDLARLARRHGWYSGRPAIADPALASFVDAFGWRNVCDADVSDPTFRAQFRDSYRRYVERHRAERARAAAAGELEAHDRQLAELTAPAGRGALDVVPGQPDHDDTGAGLVPKEAL